LVFVHDDVLIVDFFWLDKLVVGFSKFDILGVAGNKRRSRRQPSWAFIDDKFTWDDRVNLSGVVGHGKGFPCQLSVYGVYGQECKLLDGVLLATKKGILDRSKVSFDERFDFDFYDLDLCRQAESRRLRLGTVPLGIVHASPGNFGTERWRASYDKYLQKWGD
jgi:hypothetical protein